MTIKTLLLLLNFFGADFSAASQALAPEPAAVEPAPASRRASVATPARPAARQASRPPQLAALPTPVAAQVASADKAARPDANRIVEKVQAFYEDTEHLQAKFRQTVVNATFGRKTESSGYVYLEKPGKMRWDYYRKQPRAGKPNVSKAFLSDGNTLWAVFVDDKTYYQKKLEDDVLPVAVTFLVGKGDLRRDFSAALDEGSKYGAKGDYVLELTPKKPSAQYRKLWLVVDPQNFRVKQSIVENSKGDTNQFRFYEPKTAADIDDGLFVFNPKANRSFRRIQPPRQN